MFNATLMVIEAFIRELQTTYERTYSTTEPGYPGVISFVAHLLLKISRPATPHTTMLITPSWSRLSGRKFCAAGTLASAV
jgi:hypothetical protein